MKNRTYFCLLLLCLLFSGCARTPITGKKALFLTSEREENKQGELAYKQILAKEKPSRNYHLVHMVEKIGRQIAHVANKPEYKWEFKLLESDNPNAFCLPGGKVAIYTGILKYAQNEAGLAAIMGHEIGHALARHGGQRIAQHQITNIGLLLAGTAVASKISEEKRQLTMAAMGAGVTLGVLLPYSRGHETEADDIGLILMSRAGYDPREAVNFWNRFSSAGGKTPEFLSTHPSSRNRSQNLRNQLGKALEIYNQAPQRFGRGASLY